MFGNEIALKKYVCSHFQKGRQKYANTYYFCLSFLSHNKLRIDVN
jgi:hypothetical protein